MKKLVLAALAAMVLSNGAWADVCSLQKSAYASCLRYESGANDQQCGYRGRCCKDHKGKHRTLEQLRMELEACLVQWGGY